MTCADPIRRSLPALVAIFAAVCWLPGVGLAQPTPEEFFQSMGRSIERTGFESIDYAKVLAFLLLGLGLALIGWMSMKWWSRPVQRRNLNHTGKLMREMVRSGAISASDMRKLTAAAEKRGLPNPLLLALCPSLLKQSPTQKQDSPKHQ